MSSEELPFQLELRSDDMHDQLELREHSAIPFPSRPQRVSALRLALQRLYEQRSTTAEQEQPASTQGELSDHDEAASTVAIAEPRPALSPQPIASASEIESERLQQRGGAGCAAGPPSPKPDMQLQPNAYWPLPQRQVAWGYLHLHCDESSVFSTQCAAACS
eukprot:m.424660 g.424660  ORF g.424660 m.424660 type:complete len:162 (+) comp56676_c0_seq10:3132-3617(+)